MLTLCPSCMEPFNCEKYISCRHHVQWSDRPTALTLVMTFEMRSDQGKSQRVIANDQGLHF